MSPRPWTEADRLSHLRRGTWHNVFTAGTGHHRLCTCTIEHNHDTEAEVTW